MSKTVSFRRYTNVCGMTADYSAVRDFLIAHGHCGFTYARWDWMTTHSYLEKESLSKIGVWEADGKVVAMVTFDCQPGETYLIALPPYRYLLDEMVAYAVQTFGTNPYFSIVITDTDQELQQVAANNGLIATPEKEFEAVFYPATTTDYALPNGFTITDLQTRYDLKNYERVLWKGFDHEQNGEGLYDEMDRDGSEAKAEMERDNVDLSLKIAAVSPEGMFAAYCGMWFDKKAGYAVIEPVATDPDYRKIGLGKAVVLEGIKRVLAMGAKFVVVGSSQQFYYSIGMRPFTTATKWVKTKEQKTN